MGAPRGPHRHRACPPVQQQLPLRLASSAGVEEQPALPASPFRRTWQAGMKKALERVVRRAFSQRDCGIERVFARSS
jgi:hypothetical protein